MGFKAAYLMCLFLAVCLTSFALALPERTIQGGTRIVGSKGDYVLFSDVVVAGGSVYIGGCSGSYSNHNWTLWRLSPNGSLTYIEGGWGCVASLDTDGSIIYAVGTLEHGSSPKLTGFIAALSTNLKKQWEKEWVGSSLFSYFRGVAVGEDGIYVAGVSYTGERATDIVLQKYSRNGSLIWEKVLAEPGYQEPESIALSEGKVYIVGTTAPHDSRENVDGILIVADSNGSILANFTWGGKGRDFFKSIQVYDSEVYICGFTDSYGEGGLDGLILKVNQSGKVLWWKTFGGAGDDSFIDLTVYNGRIHVVGHATTAEGMLPVYLQYGLDGALLGNWTLALNSSSWTGVYASEGVVYAVGNRMRGMFSVDGISSSYVTSYLLRVNLPEDGLWASLDGVNKTGRSVSFEARGGEHRLEVASCKRDGETRIVFVGWSDSATDNPRTVRLERDTVLDAFYRREHHVTVTSELGLASGEGWYAEGSTATVSVSPSVIPSDFLTIRVFDGWVKNGRKISFEAVYSFNVTEPVHLVASWRNELNFLALLILLLLVGVLALLALIVFVARRRRKREPAPPPPPPPLPRY
ncbi:hypothetical protein [Infirmifilum sp. SLHALR2]|nr:MAG: hypothetical protein B7L53_00970 [Thermofilum sp. NZ13]